MAVLGVSDYFGLSAGKGKGCDAMVAFDGAEDGLNVFMGGVGVTAFSTAPDNQPSDLPSIVSRDTVAMEWVTNRFFGKNEKLGEIEVRFKAINKDRNRSSLVIVGNMPNALFPGAMVNTLYFEMYIPKRGMILFNKDPLVLRSRSLNTSADTIREDPRYARDPRGLPRKLREIVAGTRHPGFAPVGVHEQRLPLPLYDKRRSDRRVAQLLNATVHVVPHYGLEIELLSSKKVGKDFAVEVRITNLTRLNQEVRWYTDALNGLKVISRRKGKVSLSGRDSPDRNSHAVVTIRAQPVGSRTFSVVDCVFISASNSPSRVEEFISNCMVLSVQRDRGRTNVAR